MIFDIWRLVVRAMLIIGLTGIVVFILGLVGDPKIIKNKRHGKMGININGFNHINGSDSNGNNLPTSFEFLNRYKD